MNPLQSLYYVSPACLLCLLVPFGMSSDLCARFHRRLQTPVSCRCSALHY